MRKVVKKTIPVMDKVLQERIKVLEADPEFIDLWELLPKVLAEKESGVDSHVITTDREGLEITKDRKVIVLSKSNWDRYQEFQQRCHKLAEKWGLHWATVQDLVMGVRQPVVSARQSPTIKAYLDPVVFLPKDFNPGVEYVAHREVVPPLEAIEIIARVQGLDEQTKEEIEAYLFSLFKDKHGCCIVELCKAGDAPEKQNDEVGFDVCLRVPIGYTGKEVAEVYRKADKRRRGVLASLGVDVPKRRRQSKTLIEAETLELLEKNVRILGIVENVYPDGDLSQDQIRSIINKRYKGRELLKKRYPTIDIYGRPELKPLP